MLYIYYTGWRYTASKLFARPHCDSGAKLLSSMYKYSFTVIFCCLATRVVTGNVIFTYQKWYQIYLIFVRLEKKLIVVHLHYYYYEYIIRVLYYLYNVLLSFDQKNQPLSGICVRTNHYVEISVIYIYNAFYKTPYEV